MVQIQFSILTQKIASVPILFHATSDKTSSTPDLPVRLREVWLLSACKKKKRGRMVGNDDVLCLCLLLTNFLVIILVNLFSLGG